MAVAVLMHESIADLDLYVKRIMGHYTSAPSVLDYWVQLVGEQRRCSQGGAALRPYGPCYDHLPEPTLPITMDGALV
jgi:hypothetical protein